MYLRVLRSALRTHIGRPFPGYVKSCAEICPQILPATAVRLACTTSLLDTKTQGGGEDAAKCKQQYPRAFSHIGITVPDIHEAFKFYTEVFGWYAVMKPTKVRKETSTPIGAMCLDVFGDKGWDEGFWITHLATSDGIGVEIFSFNNDTTKPEFNPFKTGLFHFCIQD
eukprot:Filipodium_phascolosomae@DN6497_c0_g1_i1.p1